ncbi:eukaryotic rRNA processing [Pilobolus umbonatus]|nr:eukaryotic rRNA processing [Pilobolus umbonatus]
MTDVPWINLEDIDGSDIDDEYGDMIVQQKLLINNTQALERITEDFKLTEDEEPIYTSSQPLKISDVFDDIEREEAFYNQALEAVVQLKDTFTYGVPEKFIAPMLKDDKHMEEVRQRLIEEAKDGDEDALHRLHVFSKELKKNKQTETERLKLLKRKRKEGTEIQLEDEFNVDLDEAERLAAATSKRSKEERPPKQYTKDTKNEKYALGSKQKGKVTKVTKVKKSGKKSYRLGKQKRQALRR